MTQDSLFEQVGRFFFTRKRVLTMRSGLNAAGIDLPPDAFAGYMVVNILVIALFLAVAGMLFAPFVKFVEGFIGYIISSPPAILLYLVIIVLALFFSYFSITMLLSTYLVLMADNRRNSLESSLPDFLMLVASNIKAGMTLDQAMWYSAKPEFGLLSQEVKLIIKSAFSGESLEDALDRLSLRFDSRVFTRTIALIKQATFTGGELNEILERTAEDVRNTLLMKKEISASLILYEIFVLFAAAVGSPFLFAVSHKLVQVFESVSVQVPSGYQVSAGVFSGFSSFKFTGPVVSSTEFFYFTIPTLFITALFSSFIVSIIRTGNRSQGLKYLPFVLVVSYLIYWLVGVALSAFFSTLI